MKTACSTQCPQCPFRRTSLRSWLGSYTPGSLFTSIWDNQPFFCHTKINYSDESWAERAAKKGKLCLGSMAFADKMMAPVRANSGDSEVLAARAANRGRTDIECMTPNEFMEHHREGSLAESLSMKTKTAKPKSSKLAP